MDLKVACGVIVAALLVVVYAIAGGPPFGAPEGGTCMFAGLEQPNEAYRASMGCDEDGNVIWYSPDYKPPDYCYASPDPYYAPAGECISK
jgi:hypothetical protein